MVILILVTILRVLDPIVDSTAVASVRPVVLAGQLSGSLDDIGRCDQINEIVTKSLPEKLKTARLCYVLFVYKWLSVRSHANRIFFETFQSANFNIKIPSCAQLQIERFI